MAEDPQPGPADDQPEENKPEPYRLGGSGGAKGPGDTPGSGGQPGNPLEALFASLAGGDMNALAAQLQSAFAMLGGAGSMFAGGLADTGSGVNWEVTKDTARKTAASLGPDPSPNSGAATRPGRRRLAGRAVAGPGDGLSAGQRHRRGLEPGRVDRADAAGVAAAGRAGGRAHRRRDGGSAEPGRRRGRRGARDGGDGADAPAHAADLRSQHVRPAAGSGPGPAGHRGGRRDRHRAAAERAGACRPAADQRRGVRRRVWSSPAATSPCTSRCASAPGSGCSRPRAGCGSRC